MLPGVMLSSIVALSLSTGSVAAAGVTGQHVEARTCDIWTGPCFANADMNLGGCAIGISNIGLFAKMTGLEFHVEGPVGQFALGRPAKSESSGN